MKYAWIAKHKTRWPVTLSCEVLEVSASGYFEHASASGGPRLATSASFLPLEGSSTSKRLLPATHWPLIRASVLSRLGSLRRERGRASVFIGLGLLEEISCCRPWSDGLGSMRSATY